MFSHVSGALVLIEFTAMAFIFYFAFGSKITPPNTPYSTYIAAHGGTGRKENPTKWWFLMEVLNLNDVFGLIAPEDEQKILSNGGSSNKGENSHV